MVTKYHFSRNFILHIFLLFKNLFLQVQNAELENGLKEAKLLQSQGDNKMKELEYKIKNAKALKEKELKVMRFLDQGSVLEVMPKIWQNCLAES